MLGRIVAWLPWVAAEGFLVRTEAEFWPDGGLWLLVLWTAILLLFRGFVALIPERGWRLLFDAVLAGVCLLAAFEGGWLMLPAVAGFAACDALGLRIRLPAIPHDVRGNELRLATASTGVGWAGLALGISGSPYATAGTTVRPDGTITSMYSALPLVAGEAGPLIVAVLALAAALFAVLTFVSVARLRAGLDRHGRALHAVTAALGVVAIAAIPVLGLWLIPGAALAVAAVIVARSAVPRAGRGVAERR